MKIICFVVTLLLLVTVASCQKAESTEVSRPLIRIAYLPITHSVPVLLQNELQKNNADYEIELVKFTTWPELVDALIQNKVDGASVLFEVTLKALDTANNLKLVSLSHRDGNVIVSENGIESIKDLTGKTVAIPHKLSPHNTLLHTLLERESMSLDDIQVVELAPADMPSSLVSGAISAYVVAEPYGSISVSSNTGKLLYRSSDIVPNSVCCVLVFNDNFLTENPILAKSFISDFNDAAKAADKKDSFVVKTYGSYLNLKDNVIEKSLENIIFHNLSLSNQEYDEITEAILRYNILDTVPVYEDFRYIP